MAPTYEASKAQPPVVFPLSGLPVCVSFRHVFHPGCMRSVHKGKEALNVMELSLDVRHATTSAEKFVLEPSKQHAGLLHVRCCDNNKYWVARYHDSSGAWFVCGAADEPEEDLHKPSCTLFDLKPAVEVSGQVRFFHSQQKKYASIFSESDSSHTYLRLRDDLKGENYGIDYALNVFSVRRLSQQKELPRYVAFKGDNGKYLALKEKDPYLQFSSSDITDPAVVHETITDEYGVVRIRSKASGRFWRLTPAGWISADWDGNVYASEREFLGNGWTQNEKMYNDVNTLFKVVIKYDNYIALQSMSNGRFCKRLTDDGKTECLSACVDDYSTSGETELTVEEPVKSRDVYDVEYHVGAAKKRRTEGEPSRTIVVAANTTNETHHAKTTLDLYQRTESRWDASLTLDAGIKANLKATIPYKIINIEASVESHIDFHGEYKWGESKSEREEIKTEYSCPVPPKTKVVCTVFATKDIFDVPYSYKQKDVLVSGEVLPARHYHDGIYYGMKAKEIDIRTSEEKI